ncbi:MAG: hypothetical protein O2894_11600 [Planctomycetota bacterium]|nr:hypothetical protein [Planctomycetota bacterium]
MGLAALAVALAALSHGAEPRAAAAGEVSTHAPLDPEGGVFVDAAGRARWLFTPEFRPAPWLASQLVQHGIEGLEIHPVTPVVEVALPRTAPGAPEPAAKPPVAGRLLLVGPPAAVASARALLQQLDLATRSVFVSVLIGEVDRSDRMNTGGSMFFDKGAGPNPEGTLFRGASMGFEPDDYLRSSLTGAMPFEGTSLVFGDMDASGGAWEYTLRMLQRRGEAEFLAWPSLLCTEGEAGEMRSLDLLPQFTIETIDRNNATVSVRVEETGLKMRVTPVRVGAETAVLDLDMWMRLPHIASDGLASAGMLRLRTREVTTRITVRDREPVFIGGIVLKHGERSRRGLPRPRELDMLDPLHSAMLRGSGETEIVLLVRARIVPVRDRPPELDPELYRRWTEVGPRAGTGSLPAPWNQATRPGGR